MNAYLPDFRLKILDAIDRGIPRREVVRTFSVSIPTIEKYLRRRRQTGGVLPKPSPGRPHSILATSQERRALWNQRQVHKMGLHLRRRLTLLLRRRPSLL